MALTTYAELQSAIASWLNRDDLTSVIPDFISLAEAQMQRDLRTSQMVETADLTIDSRYTDLPADWLETIRLDINGNEATWVSPQDMTAKRWNGSGTGEPYLAAPMGTQIEVFPTPDGSYTGVLYYYEKIPVLSVSNTSNWVLDTHPDVYLYGSLIHSAPYLVEDARAQTWASMYAAVVKRANDTSRHGEWGAPQALMVTGAFV